MVIGTCARCGCVDEICFRGCKTSGADGRLVEYGSSTVSFAEREAKLSSVSSSSPLRLLALNRLGSTLALSVTVVGRRMARHTALAEELDVGGVEVNNLGRFGIHVDVGRRIFAGFRKQLLESFHDTFVEASVGREFYSEQDVQVSFYEGVSVTGHALVGDYLDERSSVGGLGLNDLSWFRSDDEVSSVEVLNLPLEPAQSFVQGQLFADEQVGALSLEDRVLLLLDDEIDVPRFHVRLFVGLPTKDDLLLVFHTLLDENLQNLAFPFSLDLVALALTYRASALNLLNHSESNLAELHLNTPSVAIVTFLCRADDDLPGNRQLDGFAVVKVLQRDLEGMIDVLSATGPRASSTASTEEHAEKILLASSAAPTLF
mmetsp:Transcript_1363/g.3383  ORF Transcript_1363/g.3383 Transcript_1363/m.3383 type:complete len:374 (-) Transcript_1363:504-1625(-)